MKLFKFQQLLSSAMLLTVVYNHKLKRNNPQLNCYQRKDITLATTKQFLRTNHINLPIHTNKRNMDLLETMYMSAVLVEDKDVLDDDTLKQLLLSFKCKCALFLL